MCISCGESIGVKSPQNHGHKSPSEMYVIWTYVPLKKTMYNKLTINTVKQNLLTNKIYGLL